MFVPGRMLHVKQQLRMFLRWELVVNLLRRQGTDNNPLPVLTASSDQLVDPGQSLLTLPLPFVYSLNYEGTELEMTQEKSLTPECLKCF